MEAKEYERYTKRLRAALESSPKILGCVALGSTADPSLRDEWSDHDFWVITEAGAQDSFLEDLSWLPDYQDIAIIVCHAKHRRTILFNNKHKAEFAVFDLNEVRSGKTSRYEVLIDRGNTSALVKSIHAETLRESESKPDALESLCVMLWTACERHYRGELLSARQYFDDFAVNRFLALISNELEDENRDVLDPRRRVENRDPRLAAEVLALSNQAVPDGVLKLLDMTERELKSRAPNLAWEKVDMVRGWIVELFERIDRQ